MGLKELAEKYGGGETDKEIIAENLKIFQYYLRVPFWAAVLWFGVSCLAGFAALFSGYPEGFFLLPISGLIVAFLTYNFLRIVFSYRILNIYYLKRIAENEVKVQANDSVVKEVDSEELPEI